MATDNASSTTTPETDEGGLTAEGCFVVQRSDFQPWDNPDNLIAAEHMTPIDLAFTAVLIPCFCFVGIFGNILCAIVFYRQGLQDRINLCLFSLALADLMTVFVYLCIQLEVVSRTRFGGESYDILIYFVGLQGFTWVSQFLSTVIASERCFCVVSPFKAKEVLKTSTMAVIIVVVSAILLGGLLAIAGPKHTSACLFDPATNKTTSMVYVTKYYLENAEILDIFDVFFYATAFPAFFIVVIVITTTITAVKLRSAALWRQQTANVTNTSNSTTAGQEKTTPGMSSKEVALTRMLIATSVLFIVCTLPALMSQIAIFTVPELRLGGRYHNMINFLWTVVGFLRVVNCSVNIFIYAYMGSKFRELLKDTLLCRRKKGDLNSGTLSAATSLSTVA